ncbi:hypothetical protein [Kaistia adipata]|uniref:hypothetical protein n=1 Tax=Kaistia adipata TaxID=166954 RepID=UPI00040D41B3|nr:hypothetical protein [Kaistia adipata]
MHLQTLSDDELLDLYSQSQTGGGGYLAPSTSNAERIPGAGSFKDQSQMPAPGAGLLQSQQYTPSVGAGSTGRVGPVFDDISAQPQRPELQAGLETRAGAASLQAMSDDDLQALYAQSKGPGDGIVRNAAAGLNSALYNTAGAPIDGATWLINKGIQGVNAATGANLSEIRDPIGGSQSIANAFGTIGVDDPVNVRANTTGERIARGVGEGIGYTVAPQATVGGLAKAGAIAPEAASAAYNLLGWPSSTAAVAGNAVAGGAAGGGAVAAMEATPDRYDPLSGLAGGMAGGAVGTLVSGIPRLAGEGARIAGDWVAPMRRSGQERMAGQILRAAADDPRAAAMALDEPGVIVPGSTPTTFQQTGDMGLGALERKYAATDPAAFNQRRADQNSARLDSLGGIQPEGHPEALTRALRTQFDNIDKQGDALVQAAMQSARTKTQALGGTNSAEASGEAIRSVVRAADTAERERAGALWKAVDPEGKYALGTDNLRNIAAEIRKGMPETAKPMEGEEASIFDVIGRLKGAIGFPSMSALRSRITTEMRKELLANGESPSYARLKRLRGAIQQDIDGVIAQKAAQEAEAVARGAMSEEDTLLARMESVLGAQRGEWLEGRAGEAGRNVVSGSGTSGTSRAAPVSAAPRSQGPGRSGFDDAASNPGMAPDAGLTPNFDDAARGRLAAATEATKQRKQTFGEGALGSMLRRSGNDGPYRLQNAAVPEKLFFPGGKSAENINKFRKAVGDDQAMGHLQDYAVAQMRKAAETPEGIIDPKRLDVWRRRHSDALKAFPALNARFADVEKASQAAIDAGTRRAQKLDDYQRGLVGRLIGAEHPEDVTRMVGSIFGRQDANAIMARLAKETNTNPEARQGLRKAVVDHMLGRYVSNTEAATSGRTLLKADQLQSFLKQNRSVLKRIFGENEMQRMQAVADDLQRANRSVSAVKLPGGSNTVQDTLAVGPGDSGKTILTKIALSTAAGAATAGFATGFAGFAAVLGAGTAMALRQNGINSVDDLVRDALLHPDRAALLLHKGAFKPDTGPAVALAKRYRQSIASGAATATGGTQEPEPLQVEVTQPANMSELGSPGLSYAEQLGMRR